MDSLTCLTARPWIDGLVDGELSAAATERLQRHLDVCPACRRHCEERRALCATIAANHHSFTVDAALRRRLQAALPRPPAPASTRFRWLSIPVAAALAASLLLTVGVPSSRQTGIDSMLDLHLRSLTDGHLIDVQSSDRHTVKPWFNGRLALSPPVPDLSDVGFVLVGGRLDYLAGQAAACIVYRRQQHVINLCLWPDNAQALSLPAAGKRAGYSWLAWQQGGFRAALMSDLNRGELDQFRSLWSERAQDANNMH